MNRFTKVLMVGVLAVAATAPLASAQPQVFVRGYVGPAYYGPAWYGPAWYGPAWGYGYVPNAGSVKIETPMKEAGVFVDGGYAGTVGQLKTFHLRAGSHHLEVRGPDGRTFYQEQITVVAGKTLKIHP